MKYVKQYTLAGILLFQAVLVAGFWVWEFRDPTDAEPFIDFDASIADRLHVRSPDESIELTLVDGLWSLPDGNPADESKIERVLEKLAEAEGGWPVATSERTAERFEVTEDSFQKQIAIYAGDEQLVDIYTGTSPSFRKVHARAADGGPIYAIEFSNHEAGTTASSWLNKYLLRPEGSIKSFERVGSFKLSYEDAGWKSEPPAELDDVKVRSYLDRFETISVYQFSEVDLTDVASQAEFLIEDQEGIAKLSVYHNEESDSWIVRSDREVSDYGVATYIGTELVKDLADLSVTEEELEDGEETTDDTESLTED